MNPRVAVVVINYNGAHLLPECLESIVNQDYEKDLMKIIVADNSSEDESRFVVEKFPSVEFYPTGGNLGIGIPTNQVAETLKSEYVVLLNYDLKLHPDCISKAVKVFSEKTDLFSVDFLQYNWKGDFIVHSGTKFGKTSIMKGPLPGVEFAQSTSYEDIIFSCAGAMMFDREKALKLGGFDSEFFLEYEDVDLCIRAQMMGWPSYFCKDAKVNHKVMDSIDPNTSRVGARALEQISNKRQIALRYNLNRFVIKVCDPLTIMMYLIREAIRFVSYAVRLKIELLHYQTFGFFKLLISLKKTLHLRKLIKKSSKISFRSVRKRYLVD
jgi:GT2 family glycosyltransferase